MTASAQIDPDYERRLIALGGGRQTIEALLEDASPAQRLANLGRWEPLVKPGLGLRERWRWEMSDGTVFYVKRYLGATFREQTDRVTRQSPMHSRGWWEYEQSRRLRESSIPAVRAVAAAELMSGPFERRSVVVFETVRGDAFDRVWRRLAGSGSPLVRGAARHGIARSLARLVSAFHSGGDCHRDLYLCHVFTDLEQPASAVPAFTLIDLARTFRPRVRRMRWMIKDLSQLDVSARQIGMHRTDRLRFLTAYLGLEPISTSVRLRYYLSRVLRRSDAILRRETRKRGAR